MEQIIVHGGNQLKGTVKIEGAKNAVLPILAATLLAEEGTTTLNNVPILSDVFTMNQVIKHLNVDIEFNEEENQVTIDATQPLGIEANYEYVSQMRASIVVMVLYWLVTVMQRLLCQVDVRLVKDRLIYT